MNPHSNTHTEEFKLLDSGFDHLWPIMRSISGPGIEKSFDWFSQYMDLTIEKVKSGAAVFDWTVPQEWHFRRANLLGPDGELICDSNESNLQVVNYSQPIDRYLSLGELKPHLHSIESLPTAVPYITSYYKRTWGFCLPHEKLQSLKPGQYHARIDSEFVDGGVPFGSCLLPGESSKEILLTSYLCHPSLANNELSGPLVLLALYRRIKKWNRRRYSYRFLLNPETIGALCFLHRYHRHLKENLNAGLILTCLGGPVKSLRYKKSCLGNSLFDKLAERISSGQISVGETVWTTPFTPDGSDERQYGSPGFQFPVGQFARTVYGEYDGYHNSLDSKDFMTITSLVASTETIERFLQYAEITGCPINLFPFGEPQLGKRGLYPSINSNETRSKWSSDSEVDGRTQLKRMLKLLNLADGQNDFFQIAGECDCSVDELRPILEKLEANGLIEYGKELPKP